MKEQLIKYLKSKTECIDDGSNVIEITNMNIDEIADEILDTIFYYLLYKKDK